MKSLEPVKRGDTFTFIAIINDRVTQEPLTGITDKLKAEIRTSVGSKISDLIITETETPGTYVFKCADTKTWPITTIYTDIQFTDEGIVTSSETIEIPVEKDVTQ